MVTFYRKPPYSVIKQTINRIPSVKRWEIVGNRLRIYVKPKTLFLEPLLISISPLIAGYLQDIGDYIMNKSPLSQYVRNVFYPEIDAPKPHEKGIDLESIIVLGSIGIGAFLLYDYLENEEESILSKSTRYTIELTKKVAEETPKVVGSIAKTAAPLVSTALAS